MPENTNESLASLGDTQEALSDLLAEIHFAHAAVLARWYVILQAQGSDAANRQVQPIGDAILAMKNRQDEFRKLASVPTRKEQVSREELGPIEHAPLSNSDHDNLANLVAVDSATQVVSAAFELFRLGQSAFLELLAQPLLEWARNQDPDTLLQDARVSLSSLIKLVEGDYDNRHSFKVQRQGHFRLNKKPEAIIQDIAEAAGNKDIKKTRKAIVALNQALDRLSPT